MFELPVSHRCSAIARTSIAVSIYIDIFIIVNMVQQVPKISPAVESVKATTQVQYGL